jgi:hypothetical protein
MGVLKGAAFALLALLVAGALAGISEPAFAAEPDTSSPTASGSTLERLQAAKAADWEGARDPAVSPIRRGTFLNQMNKADRAIEELEHGRQPAPAELDDALWVPPRHISPEERAKLIADLKQARAEDERNEQQMLNNLNWSRSAAPADTETFDAHKQQIDRVIENLEIGAPVRWSAIKQALQSPTSSD